MLTSQSKSERYLRSRRARRRELRKDDSMNTQAQLNAQLGGAVRDAMRVLKATADHVEPRDRMTPTEIDTALDAVAKRAENARDLWKGAPA
jgi:hypothetical protein